jgi:hypothetical protein
MFLNRKNIVIFFTFLFFACCFTFGAFASLEDPTIYELQEPIERIFNIVVSLVGIVLVAVLALGIWKSSMSLGDPRGLEGAKQTWTYALYGFFVVVLFFVVFSFLAEAFGIDVLISPKHIIGKVFEYIKPLIELPGASSGGNYVAPYPKKIPLPY